MGIFNFLQKKSSASNSVKFFTDPRDGERYRTVRIGNQIWMAENFRHNKKEYKKGYWWNYNGNKEQIKQYGCLYDWNSAMKLAPAGWHLPTKTEYEEMIESVSEAGLDAVYFLEVGGSSGFDAVYGGMYNELYSPDSIGDTAFYWTSQPRSSWKDNDDYHYYLCLTRWEKKWGFDSLYTSQLLSVRYVKDK